ncbi:MAG: enoyl-CoA hydratase-related protein, partial [Verrucomicrobia bacterium]|nr:enoyl-CoA hydratase-related protein [Verrucomicrobiota bacterium]
MSGYQSLQVLKETPLAEVVLSGPGKGNAMGPDFWKEIPLAFSELDQDESIRAILISGQGEHFSYGLDLKAMFAELGPLMMGQNLAKERTLLMETILRLQKAFTIIQQCRKPVIATVSGWCIGGAVDLLCACDIRWCSKDARFSVREVRVAMVADLGTLQRLPRIIGQGAARELALTGEDFDADTALRLGLVSRVLDTP